MKKGSILFALIFILLILTSYLVFYESLGDIKIASIDENKHDLTVEVTDLFGFPVQGAEVNLYTGLYTGSIIASGVTDDRGLVTLHEIIEGEYQIAVFYMGQWMTDHVSLHESKVLKVKFALSFYTLIVCLVSIATICLVITLIIIKI